jgi:signal transduction histidine kinase
VNRVGWVIVIAVAVALFFVQAPLAATVYAMPVPTALLLALLSSGSIVLAARMPRAGAGAHLVSLALFAVATAPVAGVPWPVPPTAVIALAALLAVLGIRAPWRIGAIVWGAAVVVMLVAIAVTPSRYGDGGWVADIAVAAGNTLIAGVVAAVLAQRSSIRAELATARRDAELEHAQRRAVEERSRIARELHDVVAHSMSVVHMRAQSAPYRLPGLTDEARAEFDGIADTARAALGEMRQLLGTLRGGEGPERAPQPRLAELSRLVESTSAAGCPTTLRVDDDAGRADAIVQLAVYRTVQEALGNVVRHAPGSTAAVDVAAEGDALRIVVENGAGRGSAPPDAGGHGLRGMRERLEALGGSLEHGPLPEGGYRVAARVPFGVTAATAAGEAAS